MIERILINKSNIEVLNNIISLVKQKKIKRFSMRRCYNAYNVDYEECEHSDSPELINLLKILEDFDLDDKSIHSIYVFYHEENSGIIYNIEKAKVKEDKEIPVVIIEEVSASEEQRVISVIDTCRHYLKTLGISSLPFKQGKKNSSVNASVIFDSMIEETKKKFK